MRNTGIAFLAIVIGTFLMVIISQNNLSANKRKEFMLQATITSQQSIERQSRYKECFDNAFYEYSMNWDAACHVLQLGNDCTLPTYRSAEIDQKYTEAKRLCNEFYQ